ncbi:DUF2384 domain-containing protein [Zooshikella marina]|uniref:MbcA/ParS/Xre antitoxin family protein n=1 Tax=Zooshikella ganghwensis TaxID=202772 RepID=UPI001BAE868A|nr:MbcA/ParS/Xre antitoxin family protein [Zooshikella ganghwensis]MBU2708755.1 DUF2384 domain-containing protein [Zooshikella ganghwensis]
MSENNLPGNAQNTSERLARYETAQEILGLLIAMRAEWIHEEQKTTHNPNHTRIDQWIAESSQYRKELHNLRINDHNKIDFIINEYGPIVKAYMSSDDLTINKEVEPNVGLSQQHTLSSHQTNYVLAMSRLFTRGIHYFGDEAVFLSWLVTEHEAFNGKPYDLLTTLPGIERVYETLSRMKYGDLA